MTVEEAIKVRRLAASIGIIAGFSVEFFLMPLPETKKGELIGTLLTSGDFYYALASPFVVWWWFAVFLRQRALKSREIGIAYFIFGFYLSSALRAIAISVVRLLHSTTA